MSYPDGDPFDDPALWLMDEDEWINETAKKAGITPTPWCSRCDVPDGGQHSCDRPLT